MFQSLGVSDQAAWIAIFVLLLLLGFAVKFSRKREELARASQIEIAIIEESAKFSDLGTVAVLLLIAHQAAMIVWLISAKSAVQEASVGTVWIAGNVLFGVGAIIGRRHTYRVLRDQPPDERIDPKP